MSNVRRVLTYLGYYQSRAVILYYVILNLNYKMLRKIMLKHNTLAEISPNAYTYEHTENFFMNEALLIELQQINRCLTFHWFMVYVKIIKHRCFWK